MPYEFDWEIRQIILEVQRISFVLLDLHLELYGSHTHTSLDLLVIDCIIQTHNILNKILDIRLALLLEENLSSAIQTLLDHGSSYSHL